MRVFQGSIRGSTGSGPKEHLGNPRFFLHDGGVAPCPRRRGGQIRIPARMCCMQLYGSTEPSNNAIINDLICSFE